MRAPRSLVALAAGVAVILAAGPVPRLERIAAAADATLRITYPAEGTLFPPDSVAPTVVWTDETVHVDRWNVVVRDRAGADVVTASVDAPRWRPSEDDWKRIKKRSAASKPSWCFSMKPASCSSR